MGPVSHRLKSSFAGALAGGGDPASSPLYVFGPFLRLIAGSAAGAVCFGAPLWMVVVTVIVVSLTYRSVMLWITDGSGGSGLCEEELGGWAVKLNASITVIEYTLTFLVSMAALVTFVGDRFTVFAGYWPRAALAIVLSAVTASLVNRGPKTAASFFGPATLAVLVMLWGLVIATIAKRGLHLPELRYAAFEPANLRLTLGGYVRLLALMTGIEVFANLVAAYDGTSRERARKAFGSLAIVMGTTLTAMLVLGPAILALSNPEREDVSVFTQLLDALLPAPLAYAGTLVGVFVLVSAAAASAQGLQNLALGLRRRHYVPASLGQRNPRDVAARPVWLQLLVVCLCFTLLGTREATYLSLYAAGVFILLSLTSIAAVKRLARHAREAPGVRNIAPLLGAALAALVTTAAASLIFYERASDGAWVYALLVPALYVTFDRVRARLGRPTNIDERLGRILAKTRLPRETLLAWPSHILTFVDGSAEAEAAVLCAVGLGAHCRAPAYLCTVGPPDSEELAGYAEKLARLLIEIPSVEVPARIASVESAELPVQRVGADLVIASKAVASFRELPKLVSAPVLLLRANGPASRRHTLFERVVVGLDGSSASEVVLPYVRALLNRGATVTLALIPDGDGESEKLAAYAERILETLRGDGAPEVITTGSGAARTLVHLTETTGADLVVVGSHGHGGTARAAEVALGSVPSMLIRELACPLLIVPSRHEIGVERVAAGVWRARAP